MPHRGRMRYCFCFVAKRLYAHISPGKNQLAVTQEPVVLCHADEHGLTMPYEKLKYN